MPVTCDAILSFQNGNLTLLLHQKTFAVLPNSLWYVKVLMSTVLLIHQSPAQIPSYFELLLIISDVAAFLEVSSHLFSPLAFLPLFVFLYLLLVCIRAFRDR